MRGRSQWWVGEWEFKVPILVPSRWWILRQEWLLWEWQTGLLRMHCPGRRLVRMCESIFKASVFSWEKWVLIMWMRLNVKLKMQVVDWRKQGIRRSGFPQSQTDTRDSSFTRYIVDHNCYDKPKLKSHPKLVKSLVNIRNYTPKSWKEILGDCRVLAPQSK